MSTPLYKSFKQNGTSLYVFPSAVAHLSESFQNTSVDFNFTKFALLNIKAQNTNKNFNIFDFNDLISSNNTTNFYQSLILDSSSYSDRLIESLRNYIANYDTTIKECKLNTTTDFYNINETQTQTEAIFFKWLRKMNAIDFETAINDVDYDKTLSDFDNTNASTFSNIDYFRKYLWKERQPVLYNCVATQTNDNNVSLTINGNVKLRNDDMILLNGTGLTQLVDNTIYQVISVDSESNGSTVILDFNNSYTGSTPQTVTIILIYDSIIQYVGEIDAISKVSTSTQNLTEISAFIPAQAGQTSTILFQTFQNTNYYPNLTVPILSTEAQVEILGAENLDSPIRQNPTSYPGNYYAQYDSNTLTYNCSIGDQLRYSGPYYGVLLTNNIGTDSQDYFEKLNDFDSRNIDGIGIDFNINHYFQMQNYINTTINNFDEFNTISINGNAPSDFEYNAILWYYEYTIDNVTSNNLFGITFLNNPANNSSDNTYIVPYEKLVSNGTQDGLSYQHSLNLSVDIDNDMLPALYDPESLYNTFGFDLYNNLMANMAKLNESFESIINNFISINNRLLSIQNLVYSQQSLDTLNARLNNLENLLTLYKTNQIEDSDSIGVITDTSGNFPMIQLNVKRLDYGNVINAKTSDIYNYIITNNNDYIINIIDNNRILINITNDDLVGYGNLNITLEQDLIYKQVLELNLNYYLAIKSNNIILNVNFTDVNGFTNKLNLLTVGTPVNLLNDDPLLYSKSNYINYSVSQLISSITPDPNILYKSLIYISENIFGDNNGSAFVYIENLIYLSGSTVVDYSGVYEILNTDYTNMYFKIKLNTNNLTLVGTPVVYLYRGIKVLVIRVDNTNTTDINTRYRIEKYLL